MAHLTGSSQRRLLRNNRSNQPTSSEGKGESVQGEYAENICTSHSDEPKLDANV